MKKHYLLLLVLIMFSIFSYAQKGWRNGEMEIKVYTPTLAAVQTLYSLHLNGDIYPTGYGLMYVIPKELEKLESSGLTYEILIPDLASHGAQFWSTDDAYHTYNQINTLMDSLSYAYFPICEKLILGTSAGGLQLSALKISDNVGADEAEPEVLFDGGIHGDEIGGPENLIRFARELCMGYGSNPTYTNYINTREIFIYPMVSPDGRDILSRYNANGVDINRDFGYMWNGEGYSPEACSQPESKVLRDLWFHNQFVVYTCYHSGSEFLSYPWSYRPDLCPDNAQMDYLGTIYSSTSGYTNLPHEPGYTGMYPINGSTKDAEYGSMGGIAWTIEISLDKQPPANQINTYYNINKPAMLSILQYAGYGLEGTVTDSLTNNPVAATVFVGNYYPCYTDSMVGDYHKYVLPGTYTIKVIANGYQTKTISNVVLGTNTSVTTNFQLKPLDNKYVYKVVSCQIPNNNFADEAYTPGVLGAPDNVTYSIGKGGWIVLDMNTPVTDGPGNDLRVTEGGTTPEGYTVFAGQNPEGPWSLLGAGTGTSDFDLLSGNVAQARYLKIVDDGDGTANAADAGFDLDAVQALPHVPGVYLNLMTYSINDAGGNNNGKIDPGETVQLNVILRNSGDSVATNISGTLSADTNYIFCSNPVWSFGTLNPLATGSGSYTLTAKPNILPGQNVTISLYVASNGGTYSNLYSMNFVIGQIPVVVIDLDGNQSSGPAIQAEVQANGLSCDYLTAFPANLNLYSSAFLCLGIYSTNHVLSVSEGQTLVNFLNNGGKLYMEGGDTWYYDPATPVHPMFNIQGISDGGSDLGTINGQASTFTSGMSFNYTGDNSWIDHIAPLSTATTIFVNQTPSYNNAIANAGTVYKTIGSSFEFGGLSDGSSPSTKTQLMEEYLSFFGVNASLTANFSAGQTTTCEGNPVSFYDFSSGNPTSWNWTFPGGNPAVSNLQNPVVTYSVQGIYDVTLSIGNGTNNNQLTKPGYITVNPLPAVTFAALAEVCVNWPSFQLTGGSPAGGTYSGPGVSNGYFNPDQAGTGTHSIVYTYGPFAGCQNTATQSIVVSPCTSLEENQGNAYVSVFPNPGSAQFTLEGNLPGESEIRVSIINPYGCEVFKKLFETDGGKISAPLGFTPVSKGIYYLRITGDKVILVKKFIVN